MTKRRVEPFVWLMFSGGGVVAAVFLPVLAFLFALAYPLGWLGRPDYGHLHAVVANPLTIVVLLGLFVLMLVHSAHRFRSVSPAARMRLREHGSKIRLLIFS